ncbi:ParA family protein [Lactococcus insecticola]|uniref:Cobyrinic acid a,c-diamide synthase n=1 Tax=Pseudolactococcus insecticola TaxID=2709158 RepID=A0A6A0BA04_9LACT|nr:ParA family protein [Lactococcus insecticola]GFH41288.1 cobyrinic acid a,c-diamide synthase [Lactococcus insecticola]
MSAQTYVVGNFKGGVGKSTCVQMLGFESASAKKRKTLIIDLDQQGNTSDVMRITRMVNREENEPIEYSYTIYDVLMSDIDPHMAIYNIIDNLDIIPANALFENYANEIPQMFSKRIDQFNYFVSKLSFLKDEYDAIYLDVPPSMSIFSQSAAYFADWAIIVLQTQVMSMRNGLEYIQFMEETMYGQYKHPIRAAGVIPFMLEKDDAIDKEVYQQAQELFGEHLLKNVVFKNSRLKRYSGSGITLEKKKDGGLKQWDKKTHDLFIGILDELDEHQTWFA